MNDSNDIKTRLTYARYLLDDAEKNRRAITDAGARARASSDLASAVALVALAERLEDTNDQLKAIAEDTRSLKSSVSGVEARLNTIDSSVVSVQKAVIVLTSAVRQAGKSGDK
ncbi:MAG: hypothetical protein QM758_18935 [Armatimonas sp.]